MKRTAAFLMALLCLFSLTACMKHKNPPKSPAISSPSLTVSEVSGSVEAMRLHYFMIKISGDVSTTYLSDDAPSALQAREDAPVLNITPTHISSQAPFDAFLTFAETPDSVTVRCWEESLWGDADAKNKAETITVTKDSEGNFVLKLKEGEYLYEVFAEWDSKAELSGSAYYTFRSSSTILG